MTKLKDLKCEGFSEFVDELFKNSVDDDENDDEDENTDDDKNEIEDEDTKEITDGDGVTTTEMDTQGLDYSKLVTYLTAALQESITKIETLETEMTALKARVQTLEDA